MIATLGANTGYWQIEIKESDLHKTSIMADVDTYWYKGISFGLNNVTNTYYRVIYMIFLLIKCHCVFLYLDNIITFSELFY